MSSRSTFPASGTREGRTDLFSPQAMGEFLVELIEEWELGAPHVLGPDVGGPAALFAAAESPSSLTSAIIGNGATAFPLDVDGNLKELIANPDFESLLALDGAEVVEAVDVAARGLRGLRGRTGGLRDRIRRQSLRRIRAVCPQLPDRSGAARGSSAPDRDTGEDHRRRPRPDGPARQRRIPDRAPASLRADHAGSRPLRMGGRADAWGDAALAWLDGGFARVGGDA